MAFYAIVQRLHSVAGVCTARTSAFCNFFNAVRTPLWCDRGFIYEQVYICWLCMKINQIMLYNRNWCNSFRIELSQKESVKNIYNYLQESDYYIILEATRVYNS